MLNITLGDRRLINPADDELGRDHVGYAPGMSDADMYTANHGCWVLGERADAEKYVLFSHKGIVRMAVEIDSIDDAEPMARGAGAPRPGRRILNGKVLGPGDRVYDIYVGGPAPVQGVRNPVTYVDDPRFDSRTCFCGCGTVIARGDWVPGHDQKALHKRIARIGNVKEFIIWFDENERKDLQV